MSHISDDTLAGLAGGELREEVRQEVEAHLLVCEACRGRFETVKSAWDKLEGWDVEVGSRDLTAKVMERARHEAAGKGKRSAAQPQRWLHAAAIWLVFGMLGAASGWGIGAFGPLGWSGGTERGAVGALKLDVFQNGSPGLMAEAILGFEPKAPSTESEDKP